MTWTILLTLPFMIRTPAQRKDLELNRTARLHFAGFANTFVGHCSMTLKQALSMFGGSFTLHLRLHLSVVK